jgi:hypothetical protein
MSTPTTALNLDELDRVMTSVVQPSPLRALARRRGQSRLRKLSGSLGALAVAPLALVALSALMVMLLAKLVIGLVMVGFDD